jgi:hypothetical protein
MRISFTPPVNIDAATMSIDSRAGVVVAPRASGWLIAVMSACIVAWRRRASASFPIASV